MLFSGDWNRITYDQKTNTITVDLNGTDLLKDLPELLADYEHCALDADGNLDSIRGKRIKNVEELLSKIQQEGKSR